MIEVALFGASGQMGEAVCSLVTADERFAKTFSVCGKIVSSTSDAEILQIVARCHVLIDFSSAAGSERLAQVLLGRRRRDTDTACKLLICSTGLSDETLQNLQYVTQRDHYTTLFVSNTSLGIALLYQTLEKWVDVLGGDEFDVEIVETHHRHKQDAPSGTAKLLLEPIVRHSDYRQGHGPHQTQGKRQGGFVGIHALRGGGVFGEHEVHFISAEEHLCISHRALSRKVFARGALHLAQKLCTLTPGFYRYRDLDQDFLKQKT